MTNSDGDILENIGWLLENVHADNYNEQAEQRKAVAVGKMNMKIQNAIGASDDLVYLKKSIYAKIRGWWEGWRGHSEITDEYYITLPFVINQPAVILHDKKKENTFLFVGYLAHHYVVVIELEREEDRNEVNTMFFIRERSLKNYDIAWGNKKSFSEGTAISPILAPQPEAEVAGGRFSSLRKNLCKYYNLSEKELQTRFLSYRALKEINSTMFGKKALSVLFSELREKKEIAFIPFLVLGDPDEERSLALLEACAKGGADMIEVGIPYSEPLADGPVIQKADLRALYAGINVDRAFGIVKRFKMKYNIPVGLLVYYNLIHARGFDSFYKLAQDSGIDAVLAADAPVEESQKLLEMAGKYGLAQVFFATPTTTEERLKKMLTSVSGYIYIISVLGVTGAREKVQQQTIKLIKWIKARTEIPLCVGFGISNPEHVKEIAASGADGAITGSAMIAEIEKHLKAGDEADVVEEFVRKMKASTR